MASEGLLISGGRDARKLFFWVESANLAHISSYEEGRLDRAVLPVDPARLTLCGSINRPVSDGLTILL